MLPQDQPGSLVVTLPLSDAVTPSDRVGAVGEWVLTIVGVIAIIVGIRRARRPDPVPPDTTSPASTRSDS